MGRKKTRRRGRLRGLAAGLCATAAAFIPGAAGAGFAVPGAAGAGVAAATSGRAPEAIEAATRTTPAARLLELANAYPEQVLANRALRRLRADDPDAHREILLAARFARAELPLARLCDRTDKATLRLYACDCAARVTALYERLGCDSDLLVRARAGAVAAFAARPTPEPATREPADPERTAPATTATPSPASALEIALARVEQDVAAFEAAVDREAAVARGAMGALAAFAFNGDNQPRRALAVAMAAARAIDEALLVAAGGSVSRLDGMREAIAEAVYLDHVFRTGEPAGAIDAVFRELAWQRSHLHLLRSNPLAEPNA